MSSSPGGRGGPPAKPGVGASSGSGGDAGPLHQPSADPPHRPGEELKRLDDTASVSGRQIVPADLPGLASLGIRLILNNRPDGEEPGQPSSAEIEAAARAAGLDYRHIPIAGGFPPEAVEAMADALENGPLLAFCRSGTRSTWLWALGRSSRGADPEALIRAAAQAGYDLSPLRLHLRR